MKPENWARSDLQKEYDDLRNEQQPYFDEHRKLREKMRNDRKEKGQIDPKDLEKMREGNKKIEELEKKKREVWDKNLGSFFGDLI